MTLNVTSLPSSFLPPLEEKQHWNYSDRAGFFQLHVTFSFLLFFVRFIPHHFLCV